LACFTTTKRGILYGTPPNRQANCHFRNSIQANKRPTCCITTETKRHPHPKTPHLQHIHDREIRCKVWASVNTAHNVAPTSVTVFNPPTSITYASGFNPTDRTVSGGGIGVNTSNRGGDNAFGETCAGNNANIACRSFKS
jgi:hypothetical protein